LTEIQTFAGLTLDRPRLMGVLNVTPDSFSDGGDYLAAELAIRHGLAMLADGADIVDVGGESTRPNAAPVSLEEELARVLPVVEALARDGALVSIDTRQAEVMRRAIAAGARIVNDVTALSGDPDSAKVCADAGVDVVLMHMQGEPRTMQIAPSYEDVVADISAFFVARVEALAGAGIDRARIAIDPGIGFGKNLDHNLTLLAKIDMFHELGQPVLMGASRKSFINRIDRDLPAKDRLGGSLAAVITGLERGVQMFRVHDVAATRQAIGVWRAIDGADEV